MTEMRPTVLVVKMQREPKVDKIGNGNFRFSSILLPDNGAYNQTGYGKDSSYQGMQGYY